MQCEALVALLLCLIKAQTEAQVGSGPCRGKIVDVFVESSYLSNGDSSLDPDTYVQVRVGHLPPTCADSKICSNVLASYPGALKKNALFIQTLPQNFCN